MMFFLSSMAKTILTYSVIYVKTILTDTKIIVLIGVIDECA